MILLRIVKDKSTAFSQQVTERFIDLSAIQILKPAPFIFGATALICLMLIRLPMVTQDASRDTTLLRNLSLVSLGISILAILFRQQWHNLAVDPGSESMVKAFTLTAYVSCVPLIMIAYLFLRENPASHLDWYYYGYTNKQWIFGLYWTAMFSVLVLPAVLMRVLQGVPDGNALPEAPPSNKSRRLLNNCWVKVILVLGLAWFFYGPPWNIQHTSPLGSVDFHEAVMLGPLQALDAGYPPAIGPAAQQYGPGSQLFQYTYMKTTGQVDLIGFRQTYGVIHWLAYAVFIGFALLYLDTLWIPLVVVFSLLNSPFGLTGWTETGGYWTWGWPNALRYEGVLLVVGSLPMLITHHTPASPRRWFAHTISLGLLWGGLCWIAQENLMMGVMALAVFLSLAWALGAISLKDCCLLIGGLLLGAIIFWLPIHISYLSKGLLSEYIRNYFIVGKQVLSGGTNKLNDANLSEIANLSNIFRFLIPWVILSGLAVLYREQQLRKPGRNELAILALISIFYASFFGALTRSDRLHVLNTLISLPLLITLIIVYLPKILSPAHWHQLLLRVGVILLTLMFTIRGFERPFEPLWDQIENGIARLRPTEVPQGIELGDSPSLERMGFASIEEEATYWGLRGPVPMSELLLAMDELRQILGNERRVYVHSFPKTEPGLIYFLADLYPAPVDLDPTLMVFSSEVRGEFLAHFASVSDEVDAIVTVNRDIEEVELLLAVQPNVETLKMKFMGDAYYIIGSFDAPSRAPQE